MKAEKFAESGSEELLRILHVEHDQSDMDLCRMELKRSGLPFHLETATTREEFSEKLGSQEFHIVLADYRLPGWTGMDALLQIKQLELDVPLILVTGTLGDGLAVECIKLGITDYVLKDQLARLPLAIRRALKERELREAERQAVAALKEREEHYRILVENAPEAIVVLDVAAGTFVDCNSNALQLFGMSREELLKRSPWELSPAHQPDGRTSNGAAQVWVECALVGETPSFEWVYRNAKGEDVSCEVHLVRLPSEKRQLVRGNIVDIRERKRAEAALRESEVRYRGLVNNATYGIYWVTPEGKILHANPALVRMLGYESEAELLALETSESLYRDPEVRAKLLAEYKMQGKAEGRVEWKCKNGKTITVDVHGRGIRDVDRKGDCIEVVVEDVTERLALEKQLVQSQKFEAIGQLAGGISHDFNNMIGAIIGWADLGMEETETDSRVHRHFEKVRQQAARAASLTRQLLAFARRQILEPRDIDLNQSILETLSLLEKVIGSNIEIKTKLARNLPVVRADPTQIEQVVMNLCINARDAMPEGGSLLIETSKAVFDDAYCEAQPFARPGHYCMVCITDTGTGMDAATLDRIFEPFFTTKEMGKGTGLGLATVYGIIRQHNGFTHVYSEVGVGTTFRVYLPMGGAAKAATEKERYAEPARGGSETILVAEDHEGLREIARETLANQGYRVLMVSDGELAIQEFQANRDQIDLVMLDVVLPKVSGPEVYARIAAEKPETPVLFATGYSPDMAMLQKIQNQNLPVLQKPYSPRELAHKVRETLDQHSRVLSRP